jgi:hypothetical protein
MFDLVIIILLGLIAGLLWNIDSNFVDFVREWDEHKEKK